MMREALFLIPVLLFGAAAFPGRAAASPRPDAPASPEASQAEGTSAAVKGPIIRVLFLGNSLTAAHDVPALVKAMANAGGVRFEHDGCISGGANIEDHWNRGRCRKLLTQKKWDWIVLQQGPSTRPESQAHLRDWSKRWADEARKRGTKTALFMVWPEQGQRNGFELVRQSYQGGATAAKGLFLPAGNAWENVIQTDEIALYSPDGLHQTLEGSYLAALVITRGLTGVKPSAVPPRLTLASGRKIEIRPQVAMRLKKAAEEAWQASAERDSTD